MDISQDVLDKSKTRIDESIKRVAKKQFADDASKADEFVKVTIAFNITKNQFFQSDLEQQHNFFLMKLKMLIFCDETRILTRVSFRLDLCDVRICVILQQSFLM